MIKAILMAALALAFSASAVSGAYVIPKSLYFDAKREPVDFSGKQWRFYNLTLAKDERNISTGEHPDDLWQVDHLGRFGGSSYGVRFAPDNPSKTGSGSPYMVFHSGDHCYKIFSDGLVGEMDLEANAKKSDAGRLSDWNRAPLDVFYDFDEGKRISHIRFASAGKSTRSLPYGTGNYLGTVQGRYFLMHTEDAPASAPNVPVEEYSYSTEIELPDISREKAESAFGRAAAADMAAAAFTSVPEPAAYPLVLGAAFFALAALRRLAAQKNKRVSRKKIFARK